MYSSPRTGGAAATRTSRARRSSLDVALLERGVPLVREAEVVPGDLVAEHGRPLEGAQALGGDHLVVLVDVVEARLEDGVGCHSSQSAISSSRMSGGARGTCAPRSRARSAAPRGCRARWSPRAPRAPGCPARSRPGATRRDRERDVAHLGAGLDEARHRPAAAELAVVGVRRRGRARCCQAWITRAALSRQLGRRRLRRRRRSGARPAAHRQSPSRRAVRPKQPPEHRILEQRVVGQRVHAERGDAGSEGEDALARGTTPAARRNVVSSSGDEEPAQQREAGQAGLREHSHGRVVRRRLLRLLAAGRPTRFAYARLNPPIPTPCTGWCSPILIPCVTSFARPLEAWFKPDPDSRGGEWRM